MEFTAVFPTLRMHDVSVAKRFYLDWLGCSVDWESEADDGPVYMQVSRRQGLVLHLSSHHDDGTPGTVVLVEMQGIEELHKEIAARPLPLLQSRDRAASRRADHGAHRPIIQPIAILRAVAFVRVTVRFAPAQT